MKPKTEDELKKEIAALKKQVDELQLRNGSLVQRNMYLEARMKFIVAYFPVPDQFPVNA